MSNYPSNSEGILYSPEYQQELAAQRTFMARVYGWMTIGLLVTAFTSLGLFYANVNIVANGIGPFIGIMAVQFIIALAMGFLINRIPAPVAAGLFVLYSLLTGITFSILFLIYTKGSIAGTFFITGGMFGITSAYGYVTKTDLTRIGNILLMALIGLILASVVNLFMGSETLYWLISYAGVIIFTGLTAFDTQKIKQSYATGDYGSAAFEKTAVFGAFILYLDFINLFIYLLRIMGSRRN